MNDMKLMTFKAHTEERIGALVGDKVLDLTSAYAVYLKEAEGKENASILARGLIPPSMKGFLTGGEEAMEAAKTTLEYMKGKPSDKEGLDGERLWLGLDDIRLEAPVPTPGKLYCTAVNFYDHATERIKDPEARAAEIERLKGLKLDVPDVFQKPPGLVVGPRGPLIKVKATDRMDYECELAIVIGKRGKYISQDKAYEHIAGYTILIDVSARDQGFPQDVDFRMFKHDVNWTKGKGMDSGGPMGPCIDPGRDIGPLRSTDEADHPGERGDEAERGPIHYDHRDTPARGVPLQRDHPGARGHHRHWDRGRCGPQLAGRLHRRG
jgi:2-keto-4-pentenoate hydratase/2-oxohepta-3-ene-1,7-dioic acid hydratase in catechol pathway